MSKTDGNSIDPIKLVETYGLDQVRYFLLREVPFGQDGDFSYQAIVTRINHDLANDYGNLCQRVLAMIQRNVGGMVPSSDAVTDDDRALITLTDDIRARVEAAISEQQFHRVLSEIWQGFAAANIYIDRQAPWVLRKTDPARMEAVLYVLIEAIRRLTVLTAPFMPDSAETIFNLLAVPSSGRTFIGFDEELKSGTPLPPPKPVFPRLDLEDSNSNSSVPTPP